MIIGIMGKKRSGKDTLADYLVDNYGFERFSFAEPMRKFAADVFGWDKDWMENHKEEIDPYWGISYRQFLQNLGSDYFQFDLGKAFPEFRKVTGRKVWVKRFIKFAEKNPDKNFVISDVRFEHESAEIIKNQGFLIRVERSGLDYKKDNHMSEQEADSILADVTIDNNSTLESLYTAFNSAILFMGLEEISDEQ